ncbi:MAG: GxxExxY protein [Kiritimatiellaceae bacterium]|nr:GxxExxY protein [Kiritimatiellaceae bacterium]
MPITCKFTPRILSQDEFHAVDKIVMRHAFDIQNEMGRLFDETIYQNELAFRCRVHGLEVLTEGVISVEYRDFRKLYFLDMLANNGGIYELKATTALNNNNDLQLINYLLLAGLHHGKLINFGPTSVEHRFISTSLTPEDRKNVSLDTRRWKGSDSEDIILSDVLSSMLEDWGLFLSVDLYTEAIKHFLGSNRKLCSVAVSSEGRLLGHQKLALLNEGTGLHISAIAKHHPSYEIHLEKLFSYTPLRRIQWLNFNKNIVQMITLQK